MRLEKVARVRETFEAHFQESLDLDPKSKSLEPTLVLGEDPKGAGLREVYFSLLCRVLVAGEVPDEWVGVFQLLRTLEGLSLRSHDGLVEKAGIYQLWSEPAWEVPAQVVSERLLSKIAALGESCEPELLLFYFGIFQGGDRLAYRRPDYGAGTVQGVPFSGIRPNSKGIDYFDFFLEKLETLPQSVWVPIVLTLLELDHPVFRIRALLFPRNSSDLVESYFQALERTEDIAESWLAMQHLERWISPRFRERIRDATQRAEDIRVRKRLEGWLETKARG